MLTIFNRRELLTALSAEQLFRVKNALADAGIPCHTAALDHGGPFRTRGRTPFIKMDYLNQYKIYVHKYDYDRAMAAIQTALRGN